MEYTLRLRVNLLNRYVSFIYPVIVVECFNELLLENRVRQVKSKGEYRKWLKQNTDIS